MQAALADALALDGLWRLLVAAAIGGVVRGFSGFGGALIYMPAAAAVLPPLWALTTLIVIEAAGPLPNLPGAWRTARRGEVAILTAGAAVSIPAGVWLLGLLPQEPFRWGLGVAVFLVLALMIAGWRYRGRLTRGLVAAVGLLGGVMGGLAGLAGPPVVLFYMAAGHPVAVMRANLIVFFVAVDFMTMAVLAVSGQLQAAPLVVGLLVMPVYLAANVLGGRLFEPARATLYRWTAYAVIFASAVMALPVWD